MTDRALQLAEMLKHQLAHTHIQLRTIAFPLIEELAALSQGAPEGRAVAPPAEILSIIEHLHTQDNRITDNPLFAVQQKRRIYGVDPDRCDNVVWLDANSDYHEASAEEVDAMEAANDAGDDAPSNWHRTGYIDTWEFVTGGLTEKGCADYIARNGHNLHEPRIYAYGSYRNAEFIALRKWLMSLRPVEATQPARDCDSLDAFPALHALTEALLTRADNDYMARQIDAAVKVMASRGWTSPVPWPDPEFFSTPQASSNSGAEGQQAAPVAWANFRHSPPSYVPYMTRQEAEACVERSRISATQEGPFSVAPLYAHPQQAVRSEAPAEDSTFPVGLLKFSEPTAALRYLAKRLRQAGISSHVSDEFAEAIEFLLARRDDLAFAASPPSAQPAEKL